MNLFSNLCIMPIMILSATIPMMLSNFMTIWFMMEVNNFMFITLTLIKMNNKKLIFLYFMTQIIASFMFMFSLVSNPMLSKESTNILLTLSMMIKLGIPPFHLWMIMMIKSMEWLLLFLALTIQKLIPLNVLYMFNISPVMFMLIMIMSMMIPSIKMFTIVKLKTLLTYSSINQTGWMTMLIFVKHPMWIIYMSMYMMIMMSISFIMHSSNMSIKFNQITLKNFNLVLTILMMNMAGLPPLMFFMLKWTSMFMIIIQSNLMFMMICMMFNSLIMAFIYIKMMSWLFFNYKFKSKMKIMSMKFKVYKIMLITMTLLTPIMLM